MRSVTVLFTALVSSACSHHLTTCNSDAECGPGPAGEKLYCSEGVCAIGTPKSKLCNEVFPSTAPAGAIPIGVLINFSSGNDGQTTLAMKLAIEEMNKARLGDGDRPMVLHICDYGKVSGDALKSMQILARERKVLAVLGPTSSARVLEIADEVRRSGIPIVSPSATSPLLSDLQPPGLFFRVVPSDAKQGPLLAKQILPSTARYAMLYADDAQGIGLRDAFLKAFPANTPVATVAYSENPGDQPKLASRLQQILTAGALDYLVAITNVFSDQVVTGLKPLSTTTKILMADGAKNENVLALANTADMATKTHLARISGTAPTIDSTNGLYSMLLSAFAGRFQQNAASSIYNAFSYDAAYAVGIALAGAGNEPTPTRIAEMLLRINGGAKMISVGGTQYLNAKRAIQQGAGLTLSGTSGGIGFDTHGDRLNALFEKWTINTTVTPPRFDSTPLQ